MPALEVRGVTKTYGTKIAVNDVSFSVEPGEVFGLLGPNGAGKTSLIRMVMDIMRPDSGEIRVLDKPPGRELKSRVGYLPEERGLYQSQKVGEVLRFLGELKGLPRHVATQRADRYLERVGLLETRNKRMKELSKGMQQKVQIAAVALPEPEFLILDEPFEGLDPVNQVLITELIKELQGEGKTIVLSSHRMDQVEVLCRNVVLLNQGQTILSGGVREIREKHADSSVTLEVDRDMKTHPAVERVETVEKGQRVWLRDGTSTEELLSALITEGVKISRFEKSLPSLNDVFVRAVSDG